MSSFGPTARLPPSVRLATAGALVLGLAALSLLLLSLGLAGCAPSPEAEAAARDEIREDLEEYLPLLARAYAEGDPELLAAYAAEKERALLARRVSDLQAQGQRLAPELEELTVEDVVVWNSINAYVTTLEVWDVKVKGIGSETVLREELGQPNRVKYQLKYSDGRWRVMGRQLEQTIE